MGYQGLGDGSGAVTVGMPPPPSKGSMAGATGQLHGGMIAPSSRSVSLCMKAPLLFFLLIFLKVIVVVVVLAFGVGCQWGARK